MDSHANSRPGGDTHASAGTADDTHDRVRVDTLDPLDLLEILEGVPAPMVVGFEPAGDDGIDLHAAPLPDDERCGAAGMFCLVAPQSWTALGVVVAGRTRHLGPGAHEPESIDARLVVTRAGGIASSVVRSAGVGLDGSYEPGPNGLLAAPSDGAPEGLIVDAVHRALGLPSPGERPPPVDVALGVWSHAVLGHLLDEGDIDWPTTLELHPGEPGLGAVMPSIETVAEATLRCADDLDWQRMHRRASLSSRPTAELSPAEAAWMDTTMFARWVVGSLPDPETLIRMLGSCCSDDVAIGMEQVVARIHSVQPGTAAGAAG